MAFSAKQKIILQVLVIFFILDMPIFAEIDMRATGYDWVEWLPQEKIIFINTLRLTSQIGNKYASEVIAGAVDAFYYGIKEATQKGLSDKEADNIFKAPCVKMIPMIIKAVHPNLRVIQ